MAQPRSTQTSVRVNPDLTGWLAERSQRHGDTGSTGLSLLHATGTLRRLLAAELRRQHFTLPQAQLLAAITAGEPVSAEPGQILAQQLTATVTGLEHHYAQKFELGDTRAVAELVNKLAALCPGADMALRDALAEHHQTGAPATAEGFASVGIRVIE